MTYTRELKTVVPVLIAEHTKADDELLVWLVRESFERAAAAEYLTLTAWSDCGELHPSEVSPQTEREVLKRPATDYRWRAFTGTATRSADASLV
ncbi:MAG: hypothetical protein ACRDTI_12700 [Mycobacterium sp.]